MESPNRPPLPPQLNHPRLANVCAVLPAISPPSKIAFRTWGFLGLDVRLPRHGRKMAHHGERSSVLFSSDLFGRCPAEEEDDEG